MERETKLIQTPNGKQVELKTYITGREKRAIESIYYRDVEMTATAGEQTIKGFKGSAVEEAQNKAIETVVVSLDGQAEDLLNRVLDLHIADYQAVMQAIDEITADKKKAT